MHVSAPVPGHNVPMNFVSYPPGLLLLKNYISRQNEEELVNCIEQNSINENSPEGKEKSLSNQSQKDIV